MAEMTKTIDSAINTVINREGKYLTFSLGNEEYGIGIIKIREIIGMMPITPVPRTHSLEVLYIREEDIEEARLCGQGIEEDHILGIAKMEDGVKILLDINKVLRLEDKMRLTQAA